MLDLNVSRWKRLQFNAGTCDSLADRFASWGEPVSVDEAVGSLCGQVFRRWPGPWPMPSEATAYSDNAIVSGPDIPLARLRKVEKRRLESWLWSLGRSDLTSTECQGLGRIENSPEYLPIEYEAVGIVCNVGRDLATMRAHRPIPGVLARCKTWSHGRIGARPDLIGVQPRAALRRGSAGQQPGGLMIGVVVARRGDGDIGRAERPQDKT